MVLCNLPVSGHHINLDYSRARAHCASSWSGGGGLFGHFFSRLSFLFFVPFSESDPM